MSCFAQVQLGTNTVSAGSMCASSTSYLYTWNQTTQQTFYTRGTFEGYMYKPAMSSQTADVITDDIPAIYRYHHHHKKHRDTSQIPRALHGNGRPSFTRNREISPLSLSPETPCLLETTTRSDRNSESKMPEETVAILYRFVFVDRLDSHV